MSAFDDCSSLSTIYVPAKKTNYDKERLCEELHDKIVELEPEKKTKIGSTEAGLTTNFDCLAQSELWCRS